MRAVDLAAFGVAIISILGGVAAYVQFMIKHYLSELKPNSGSSIKDQISRLEIKSSRLEARVDTIIEMLGK
jgi:DNA-binding MarR family transcriptional regulator